MASSARIDELRKKFEENPRRYFAPLANEYRKAGDIEQAISICREYLPQQPGHMSGHIVYGQALYEARQYEEARTVFETALALDPENLIALRHLGDIALIVGDIEGARTWYGRVLEADPRNEEIQAQLKSLESVTPAAAPTPMSTPAIQAPLPSLELALPSELAEVARTPASSAPTVVIAAIPAAGPVERTVELPASPPPAPVQSLSTTPTAEITLDQVPIPAVPDLEKAAEAPRADLPVEKAAGFEPTGAAPASESPVTQAAGLETTSPPPSEAPPIDSFRLEGLETTSVSPPPAGSAEPPPAATSAEPPAPLPDLEITPPTAPETTAPATETPAAAEPVVAEEPAPASSELTFLDVDTPAATPASTAPSTPPASTPPASAPPPEPPMAESKPFVTETMAELYEQQGHRDEALRVYRALQEQRPGDEHIRSRIEQLEGKRGPTIRELLARVAARRPAEQRAAPATTQAAAPPSQPQDAPAVEAPEVSMPVEPSVAPAPSTAAATSPSGPRNDQLGRLFNGAPVGGADENAAVTLSAAFSKDGRANGSGASQHLSGAPAHPASKDLSLDAVFGTEAASPPPASSFSFDQFFSERATAEQPTPATRSASEGAGPGQETKDDVAKFTQWLEGLKQR